jgi:hypothetical protein
MAKERKDQLSVTFEPGLLAAIERAAAQEHRTVSGQVRHYAAKAIEEQPHLSAGSPPCTPPLATRHKETT